MLGLRISCGFQDYPEVVVSGFLLPPGNCQPQSPEAWDFNYSEVSSGTLHLPWGALTPVFSEL